MDPPLATPCFTGLQPEDAATFLGLAFHNFLQSYAPPPDPLRAALPRSTLSMQVRLRVRQLVLHLHPSEASEACARLDLDEVALDVSKVCNSHRRVSESHRHVSDSLSLSAARRSTS